MVRRFGGINTLKTICEPTEVSKINHNGADRKHEKRDFAGAYQNTDSSETTTNQGEPGAYAHGQLQLRGHLKVMVKVNEAHQHHAAVTKPAKGALLTPIEPGATPETLTHLTMQLSRHYRRKTPDIF
jgi:hypothetical protein